MEENRLGFIMDVVKIPFVFLFYVLYLFFSIFIPTRYVSKLINIEGIEANINYYINNHTLLKIVALIITILIFIFLD